MRVRGDLAPNNAFTLEEQPKKPGIFLVRFYENISPFEETKEGLTISGFEYDEYHLEMENTGDLEADILGNFDTLLAQAKAADPGEDEGGGDLEDRVISLENEKADKAEVQAVWDEMAAAYSEGVQEA